MQISSRELCLSLISDVHKTWIIMRQRVRDFTTFDNGYCSIKLQNSIVTTSSVARGGAGGARAPHWLVKYAKSHVFCAFEADFL